MSDTQRNTTTMDDYQTRAFTTAVYPGRGEDQVIYPAVALCEEAGELAGVVMDALNKHRIAEPGDYHVAAAALNLASTCGKVMGLVKKAFRNDPQGVLTPDRLVAIRQAATLAESAAFDVLTAIQLTDRVEFPRLVLEDVDRDKATKEVGDVLWYAADFCTEIHVSLGYVGDVNYDKLADRARRDVLRSAGDTR